ncbi:MAG: hypothetical protein KGS47_04985 [Chloroflexi bacterium]|nr:hypothetical protein [Chloroflexota bacterium]
MVDDDQRQAWLERLQEDERLRGDLEDAAALALLEWAQQQTQIACDDESMDLAGIEIEVQQIRAAARAAARAGGDAATVVERAAAELLGRHGQSATPTRGRVLHAVTPTAPAVADAPEAPAAVADAPAAVADAPAAVADAPAAVAEAPAVPDASVAAERPGWWQRFTDWLKRTLRRST